MPDSRQSFQVLQLAALMVGGSSTGEQNDGTFKGKARLALLRAIIVAPVVLPVPELPERERAAHTFQGSE